MVCLLRTSFTEAHVHAYVSGHIDSQMDDSRLVSLALLPATLPQAHSDCVNAIKRQVGKRTDGRAGGEASIPLQQSQGSHPIASSPLPPKSHTFASSALTTSLAASRAIFSSASALHCASAPCCFAAASVALWRASLQGRSSNS